MAKMRIQIHEGEEVHVDSLMLERQFKSGKSGYGHYGKIHTDDGRHYQVSVNIVQYQSKAERENAASAPVVKVAAKLKRKKRRVAE